LRDKFDRLGVRDAKTVVVCRLVLRAQDLSVVGGQLQQWAWKFVHIRVPGGGKRFVERIFQSVNF
jgi:hypothetical protein